MLKLDDRDLAILKVLCQEARISKADLAKRINLSPSPCWKRLERLEKAGVIEAYRAEISLKKLVSHVTVFVTIELEHHRAEYFQRFERAIQNIEAITHCWAVGGGLDYLLQINTRDIDTYQRLIDGLLEKGLGVARYFTYIVTKPIKCAPLPLDDLLALEIANETAAPPSD